MQASIIPQFDTTTNQLESPFYVGQVSPERRHILIDLNSGEGNVPSSYPIAQYFGIISKLREEKYPTTP